MRPTIKFAHDNLVINEQTGEIKIKIPKRE